MTTTGVLRLNAQLLNADLFERGEIWKRTEQYKIQAREAWYHRRHSLKFIEQLGSAKVNVDELSNWHIVDSTDPRGWNEFKTIEESTRRAERHRVGELRPIANLENTGVFDCDVGTAPVIPDYRQMSLDQLIDYNEEGFANFILKPFRPAMLTLPKMFQLLNRQAQFELLRKHNYSVGDAIAGIPCSFVFISGLQGGAFQA